MVKYFSRGDYLNVGKFIKYKEIKTYFQEFVSLFIISALSNTTLFYKDYRRPYVNKKKDFVVKILFFLGCDSVGVRTQDPQLRRLLL